MSMRSMLRPRTKKCQPSSWLKVASVSPASNAARSRTNKRYCDGPRRRAVFSICGSRLRVEFSATHISEEMNSRLRRAFSNAPLREPAMEFGFSAS